MSKLIPVSLLALGLFTVTFAVNLQAPLYDAYAAKSDVGATAVTIAFAAYVGGLMPTLLLLGGLSDRIGRRGPIALALILGAAATALLVQLPSWTSLVIARFTPRAVSLLRLPVFPAGSWVFGAAMALAWSTTGMTIAVVPLELAANNLGGWTGLVIFLAIFVGFLCQPIARCMTNEQALTLGFVLIPLGFLVLLAGVWLKLLTLVLLGTCITSAASYGFTYLASLAEVSLRAPDDRARATAGLFVYAYFGFSLPVIASGILADRLGLLGAMIVFAVAQSLATALIVVIWTLHERHLFGLDKRV